MDTRLFIETENGKIYLTPEQSASIRNQIRVQDAISVLDCMGCTNIDELSQAELISLGLLIEDAIYDDVGDIEYDTVYDFNEEIGNVLKFDGDGTDADDENYNDYVDRLDELDLNTTDYDYYRNCLDEIHCGAERSYSSYALVLDDAIATANQYSK